MKKIMSLAIIVILCLSTFSIITPQVKAQEIIWNTNPTPLPIPIAYHASIVCNGRIYVIGGNDESWNRLDTVYFADILPDGTVGSWTPTISLPEGRSLPQAVVWNNYIYALGGSRPGGGHIETDTVWYAPINPDGTLGSWIATTSMPYPATGQFAVVWNGRIYMGGGWTGYGWKGEVYYAEINPDGSVGSWNPTTSLPAPRRDPATSVHNGIIYVIGGQYPSMVYHSTVYYATINPDGTVGAWSTTSSIPSNIQSAEAVLVDDNIYVVGGHDGSVSIDTVFSGSTNPDGTVGSWTTENSLPEPRTALTSVSFEDIIYVIGGEGIDGLKDTIYHSSLQAEELLPLPAEAYYRFPGQFGAGCVLEWMDIQTVTASPGETVAFSIRYHIWNLAAPGEIKQAFFIVSWTPSWPPPAGYYIPIYDGIAGLSPGITETTSFSVTVPNDPGTYYLWWCTSSHFSMEQAVAEYTTPLALPAHAKIVVSTPPAEPDFEISVSPESQTVKAGDSVSYEISLTPLNGFDSEVYLEADWVGTPPATGSPSLILNPWHLTPPGISTFTVDTYDDTELGQFTIEITAVSGSTTHSIEVTLIIIPPPTLNVPYYGQGTSGWCQLASTSMVLKYFGLNIHMWDIGEELKISAHPSIGLEVMCNYVESKGLQTVWRNFGVDLLDSSVLKDFLMFSLDSSNPVVLSISGIDPPHVVVVVGYSAEDPSNPIFYIHDPSGALIWGELQLDYTYPLVAVPVSWVQLVPVLDRGRIHLVWARAFSVTGTIGNSLGSVDISNDIAAVSSQGTLYTYFDRGISWKRLGNHKFWMDETDSLSFNLGICNQQGITDSYNLYVRIMIGDEVKWDDTEIISNVPSYGSGLYSVQVPLNDIINPDMNNLLYLELWDLDFITRYDLIIIELPVGPPISPVPYYSQGETMWDLPTSMAMIMGYYGYNVHPYDIADLYTLSRNGRIKEIGPPLAPLDAHLYFLTQGLDVESMVYYAVDLDIIKNWIKGGWPVILGLGAIDHAVVLIGYSGSDDDTTFYLNDPSGALVLEIGGHDFPYFAEEVKWSDLSTYVGLGGYALAVLGQPAPLLGTIDIADYSIDVVHKDSHLQVYSWLRGYDWAGRGQGLDWDSREHPLSLDPDDQLHFGSIVTNHMDYKQNYKFVVEFSREDWLWSESFDMEVDRFATVIPIPEGLWAKDVFDDKGEYTLTLQLWDVERSTLYDEVVFPKIKYSRLVSHMIHSPANLYVFDPQGRRIGFDPITEEIVNEIPDAWYSGPDYEPQVIMIPDPIDGNYIVQLVGTATGTYILTVELATFGETVIQTATGSIEQGQNQIHRVFIPESGDTVILDDDPPTTLLTIEEPKYTTLTQTYVTRDSPFTLQADDDTGSGVASIANRIYNATYDSDWTTYTDSFYLVGLSDGLYSIDYNSTDNAGNVEVTNTVAVILDNSPPTTILTIGEPKYATVTTYVTLETPFMLEADDNEGSGVALVEYRIHNSTFDSGWLTYTVPFHLTGLADGVYTIEFSSTDNLDNVEPPNAVTVFLDNTEPSVIIVNPPAGWALQDGVNFIASATDDGSGVHYVNFSIREANGDDGIPVGFENLPATYDVITGKWTLFFDTLLLPDGYYVVLVEAEDNLGHVGSTIVPYSIRNWAILELLPATENNKAGRTMPVKFTLRVAATVDPNQPFVYNEELSIKICDADNPTQILQESTFGDTARDYRINTITELYITNFRTMKKPMDYMVSVYRGIFFIDDFGFQTIK